MFQPFPGRARPQLTCLAFPKGKPKMIATLPPDEESACAFFVEWRTEVCAEESDRTKGSGLPMLLSRGRVPPPKGVCLEPSFPF